MADVVKNKPESPEQLTARFSLLSRNAKTVCKASTLYIYEKGIITQQEFLAKIAEERAAYQRMLNPTQQ